MRIGGELVLELSEQPGSEREPKDRERYYYYLTHKLNQNRNKVYQTKVHYQKESTSVSLKIRR